MPAAGAALMARRRSAEATEQLRDSLVEHARQIVRRDGTAALTMRTLAEEADCAVGLPYKVFANRQALVLELVLQDLRRVTADVEAWERRAGERTVAENLAEFARILLSAETHVLMEELDDPDEDAIHDGAHTAGLTRTFTESVRDYLTAEQRLGRVAPDVDTAAHGFLVTGAIHNLLVAGRSYPRPTQAELAQMLRSVAESLAPRA